MNIRMMTGREVVSPFDTTFVTTAGSEVEKPYIAAAFSNTQPNVCPKCFQAMGQAQLSDNEQVFYCLKCRVSHPLHD